MKRTVAGIILCAIGLLGCSGGTPKAATLTPVTASASVTTPTASPSPSPTPPVLLTKAEAAALYLRLAKPLNALVAPPNNRQHFKQWRVYYGKAATLERAFDDALVATNWPTNVAPIAQRLASQDAINLICDVTLSHEHSWSSLITDSNGSVCRESGATATAELMRINLGLPNVPQ